MSFNNAQSSSQSTLINHIPETRGDRIRRVRVALNMTQYTLAKHIGISQGYLSDLERDCAEPSFTVMESLADIANLSLDFFRNKT